EDLLFTGGEFIRIFDTHSATNAINFHVPDFNHVVQYRTIFIFVPQIKRINGIPKPLVKTARSFHRNRSLEFFPDSPQSNIIQMSTPVGNHPIAIIRYPEPTGTSINFLWIMDPVEGIWSWKGRPQPHIVIQFFGHRHSSLRSNCAAI